MDGVVERVVDRIVGALAVVTFGEAISSVLNTAKLSGVAFKKKKKYRPAAFGRRPELAETCTQVSSRAVCARSARRVPKSRKVNFEPSFSWHLPRGTFWRSLMAMQSLLGIQGDFGRSFCGATGQPLPSTLPSTLTSILTSI